MYSQIFFVSCVVGHELPLLLREFFGIGKEWLLEERDFAGHVGPNVLHVKMKLRLALLQMNNQRGFASDKNVDILRFIPIIAYSTECMHLYNQFSVKDYSQ